ncbi:MAG: pyridoxal kinase [Hyphomicrobiaceae bacterium]
MARILAISSQVARGHVGLSIIVPALQALGHEVIALPSVILSNHPGHPHCAGARISLDHLSAMLDALDNNGWLANIDAVLTGYLPSPQHVAFARKAVARVTAARNGQPLIYLCDPVLGDDPKGLYIDEAAATAIRDTLIPIASIATPNRFELSFLTGTSILTAASVFAHPLTGPITVATSIPSNDRGETLNTLISSTAKAVTRVPLRANVPHGTGDLFSALLLAARLDGKSLAEALAFATAGVDQTLAKSRGADELLITALPTRVEFPLSWPIEQHATPE